MATAAGVIAAPSVTAMAAATAGSGTSDPAVKATRQDVMTANGQIAAASPVAMTAPLKGEAARTSAVAATIEATAPGATTATVRLAATRRPVGIAPPHPGGTAAVVTASPRDLRVPVLLP